FQAEDRIRDFHVTGVQTCALPISYLDAEANTPAFKLDGSPALPFEFAAQDAAAKQTANIEVETQAEHAEIQNEQFTIENMRYVRSEERRVGKECRSQRP